MARSWRASGGAVWMAILAGCASGPQRPVEEVSNGLDRLAGPAGGDIAEEATPAPFNDPPPTGSLAAAAAQNTALDLLAWHDQREEGRGMPRDAAASPGESPEPAAAPPSAEEAAPGFESVPAELPLALEARISEAAARLDELLRERFSALGTFSAAVPLAALEPVHPGATEAFLSGPAGALLSPAESASLRAFASFAGEVGASCAGDPAKTADALQAAADGLSGSLPVRLKAAELCTRVDGYGRYQPVEGRVFQAMRPQRVIVYTEVERFACRPIAEASLGDHRAGPGDEWAVSLTQQLELYNESGAMSAWSRPALPVVETSRNKRRDFHIVDQIDLPPNLSIGVYHLKITVTDRATGSQDSRSIEIRIVADPALARTGDGPR